MTFNYVAIEHFLIADQSYDIKKNFTYILIFFGFEFGFFFFLSHIRVRECENKA